MGKKNHHWRQNNNCLAVFAAAILSLLRLQFRCLVLWQENAPSTDSTPPPALSVSLCVSYNRNRTAAATTVIATGLREPFFFLNPDRDSISVHGNAPQSIITGTSTIYTPTPTSRSYTQQKRTRTKREWEKEAKTLTYIHFGTNSALVLGPNRSVRIPYLLCSTPYVRRAHRLK